MAGKKRKPGMGREVSTPDQRRAWSDCGQVSAAWARITEEQRKAWNAYARENRKGSHLGRRRRPSGQRVFVKVNLRRKALGDLRLGRGRHALKLAPVQRGRDGLCACCHHRMRRLCPGYNLALGCANGGQDRGKGR